MDTILIQGGEMQLVSWDPGSTGGTYTVEGINMILGGKSWAFELDSSSSTCLSILPGGQPVPTGPVSPNICHVSAIDSVRPYGTPCDGCFNISTYSSGQYQRDGGFFTGTLLRTESVPYADLPSLRLGATSVSEPSLLALAAVAVVISTCMSLLTRGRGRAMIVAHVE